MNLTSGWILGCPCAPIYEWSGEPIILLPVRDFRNGIIRLECLGALSGPQEGRAKGPGHSCSTTWTLALTFLDAAWPVQVGGRGP